MLVRVYLDKRRASDTLKSAESVESKEFRETSKTILEM